MGELEPVDKQGRGIGENHADCEFEVAFVENKLIMGGSARDHKPAQVCT